MQLCGSLSILWHCLSLGLEWKVTFSSPVATAEFSKFAGILRELCVSKIHMLFPNSQCDCFENRPFKRQFNLNEVIRLGLWCNRVSVLVRRNTREEERPHQHTVRWRPPTSPEKGPQNETYLVSSLILHFSASRLVRHKFLSYPDCGVLLWLFKLK